MVQGRRLERTSAATKMGNLLVADVADTAGQGPCPA